MAVVDLVRLEAVDLVGLEAVDSEADDLETVGLEAVVLEAGDLGVVSLEELPPDFPLRRLGTGLFELWGAFVSLAKETALGRELLGAEDSWDLLYSSTISGISINLPIRDSGVGGKQELWIMAL